MKDDFQVVDSLTNLSRALLELKTCFEDFLAQ